MVSWFLKVAHAQQGITLFDPLQGKSFVDVVSAVTNFLITISIPIVAVMVLVGGFQMMTAAGNPERFSSGRKTILYAAIGFAVVLAAKSVVVLIQSILGAS